MKAKRWIRISSKCENGMYENTYENTDSKKTVTYYTKRAEVHAKMPDAADTTSELGDLSYRSYKMSFHELAEIHKVELSRQRPVTFEQMKAQIVRLFKQTEQPFLTPEEAAIWANTVTTEHQRVLRIHTIRAKKKRAEYVLRKHQRPITPKPKGNQN